MFTGLELRLIGYAVAAVGALGAYMWWHHSIFAEGAASTEAKYVLRDAGTAKRAYDRVRELEAEARDEEAKHAQALVDIAGKYAKDNANALTHKDAVIAGLRDGTTKLYVSLAGSPTDRCGSAPGTIAATAGGTDGAGRTGVVGPDDAAFLVAETSNSDRLARKVNRLQDVVRAQIKTCNEGKP